MQIGHHRSLSWLLIAAASCGGESLFESREIETKTETQRGALAAAEDDALTQVDNQRDWLQWAHDPRHTGFSRVNGEPLRNMLADIIYDPLVPDEIASTGGALLVHYQVPLVVGKDVYMEEKSGTYSTDTFATQLWHETKFRWVGQNLTTQWKFTSDWRPPGKPGNFWEPVFHAVIANDYLYVPGAGGTIFKVDRHSGQMLARLNAHGTTVDPNKYTVSPIVADGEGNLYYNAIELPPGAATNGFYSADATGAWLVKVTAKGQTSRVSYSTLVAGAPAPTDLCEFGFDQTQQPFPPPEGTPQITRPCGIVRPGLNVAPAIAPDGTIYSAARQHFAERYSYLVAINKNLTPKWSASLRNLFTDGCGVPIAAGGTMPPNGAPFGCREGAPLGVDPQTRRPGDGRVSDSGSSTPLVAPDGSIFLGTFTAYNGFRGHTVRFSKQGQYLGNYPFGWDITPAVYEHGSTYSLVFKDNYYIDFGLDSPRDFYITQLSPNFDIEWRFRATNTDHCHRDENDNVVCVPGDTGTFEWCMNAPAVDKKGTTYAISEDGWLYAIDQGGTMRDRVFLELALGAAYTPASVGRDGRIYAQNAGHLFVAGK